MANHLKTSYIKWRIKWDVYLYWNFIENYIWNIITTNGWAKGLAYFTEILSQKRSIYYKIKLMASLINNSTKNNVFKCTKQM